MPSRLRNGLRRLCSCLAFGALLCAVIAPAGARDIEFSGRRWRVIEREGAAGLDQSSNTVQVDRAGRLVLRVSRSTDGWRSAEVALKEALGYGTYVFELASDVSALDPNAVLGLFTWSERPEQAHRELDIEFSRWGLADDVCNAQYVVQPYERHGHLQRWQQPTGSRSTHRITWAPDFVRFVSSAQGHVVASWTFDSARQVPTPGDSTLRINLRQFQGRTPIGAQGDVVIVESFRFEP